VGFGWLVEGGAEDLGLDAPLHVGDLFGSLADEGHHQVNVRVVGRHRVGDGLEQQRLAGLGRRDDQAALAAPNGGDQVNQPPRDVGAFRLHDETLAREDRRQVVEVRAAFGGLWVHAVDGLDPQQAEVFLVFLGRANLARDHVAGAQPKAADLRLRDVDIGGAGQEPVVAEEAEAIVHDLEHTGAEDVPLALGLGAQQPEDQVLLFEGAVARQVPIASDVSQFGDGLGF
jgi:hypothetical protein